LPLEPAAPRALPQQPARPAPAAVIDCFIRNRRPY
jgi:hypothetical protein